MRKTSTTSKSRSQIESTVELESVIKSNTFKEFSAEEKAAQDQAAAACNEEAQKLLQNQECIEIKGAAEHNLKSITARIPKKKLVVFTGVSGSGKSSLAFDTLFAEGQRRYVESLSAYARQFLGQLDKPHYESLRGLSPTISIEQKTQSKNPRSTVGTITEIMDYLRLLYARVGVQHCHRCGRPVEAQSAAQIVECIEALPEKTRFSILAPLIENRKGSQKDLFTELKAAGFTRLRLNGELCDLEEDLALDKKRKHKIELVVDRLQLKPGMRARITDSVETALRYGDGKLYLSIVGESEDRLFSETRQCLHCGIGFPETSPQHFSFNSPLGMCPICNGLGVAYEATPELVIPDDSLSVNDGAFQPWHDIWSNPIILWYKKILSVAATKHGIDLSLPFRDLPPEHKKFLLEGSNGEEFSITMRRKRVLATWEGILPQTVRRWRETEKEDLREKLMEFLKESPCPACGGARLKPESCAVRVQGTSLPELCHCTIHEASQTIANIRENAASKKIVVEELCKEISNRLRFLEDVGLEYLSLDRPGPTLSGGESQRIRLASQLGSELTGVIYILDEPSIGLHPRDNQRLVNTLANLRDLGNSVLVVEHDAEMMRSADWILDFGPGAGQNGGELTAQGTPELLCKNPKSLTGDYLSGRREIPSPKTRRLPGEHFITVKGANANNLKGLDVSIPLGLFTCVTGVSGAGKSTLINQILLPTASAVLNHAHTQQSLCKEINGLDLLDSVIAIDQAPIGRTPRSNPATYTKLWDDIRTLFAQTKEARAFGFAPGRFSFNIKGGRCEACQGAGVIKVEMHFLADVYVPCEVCHGQRFNDATLRVTYQGHTIADVLEMSVDEAANVFSAYSKISNTLKTLQDVGLGYLKLGQPSTTLSGGEAQRIKLSRELSRRPKGRTLYILDEPSTGLHFEDIRRLLEVIQRLVAKGNSVVMIEHNLDIIKTADWIIDLGPEGGAAGGHIVAQGNPETVAQVPESYTGQHLAKLFEQEKLIYSK